MVLVRKTLANPCFALLSTIAGVIASTIAIATISTPQPARAEQLTLENLVQQAASKDPATAQEAIAKLRDFKNVGVDAFWKTYQSELPTNPQLRASLDAICQQKDCDASRLYWYKDLETAKAASKETGKPILSLRWRCIYS